MAPATAGLIGPDPAVAAFEFRGTRLKGSQPPRAAAPQPGAPIYSPTAVTAFSCCLLTHRHQQSRKQQQARTTRQQQQSGLATRWLASLRCWPMPAKRASTRSVCPAPCGAAALPAVPVTQQLELGTLGGASCSPARAAGHHQTPWERGEQFLLACRAAVPTTSLRLLLRHVCCCVCYSCCRELALMMQNK